LINFKEIIKNFLKKENFYFIIIILLIFIADRYSKIQIIKNLNDASFYVNDFLNFDLIWNTGIGFGLLSSDSTLFYSLISVVILIVIVFLIFIGVQSDKYDKSVYSVIIGGALGNFYDRIIFSAVPDFIDIHYGNFHWFTFNVADIFITLGIISFLLRSFFIKTN
tara:strand:- start:886 stop:1380 length:495 start_codon:yes stop_codon:yes gene_type:complete